MDINIREWWDWLRKADTLAALEQNPLVREQDRDDVVVLHPTYDFRERENE